MANMTSCNHEDCDCYSCETCGSRFTEGGGEAFTARIPVGYDDYDYETIYRCNACLKREEEAGHAAEEAFYASQAKQPYNADEDIPF